ncbi:MAG: nuclear transport factor 2 family protein [Erythrobacter sp.]
MSRPDLAQLADRCAIHDVLARYCRGVDRCDPAELRRVFAPDARIDYGDGATARDETIADLMEGLGAMRLTHHNIGNVICEIAGDEARAETYCVAHHFLDGPEGGEIELVVGGRYLDRLARGADAAWRITERLYVMDWNRTAPSTMRTEGGLFDRLQRRGGRAPDDPSRDWWTR